MYRLNQEKITAFPIKMPIASQIKENSWEENPKLGRLKKIPDATK